MRDGGLLKRITTLYSITSGSAALACCVALAVAVALVVTAKSMEMTEELVVTVLWVVALAVLYYLCQCSHAIGPAVLIEPS
jgi:hypothetical protein